VDHESLIELIRLCYVKIQEIMSVSAVTNPQALRYSSKLLRICIQKFGAARMACGLDEAAVTVIEQFLPSCLKLVTQIFAGIHNIADMISKLGVILELLRSVSIAREAFPDECEASFSDLMRISWGILCLIRDHAESANLGQSSRQGTANSVYALLDGSHVISCLTTVMILECIELKSILDTTISWRLYCQRAW
jgi:hypothetical protein